MESIIKTLHKVLSASLSQHYNHGLYLYLSKWEKEICLRLSVNNTSLYINKDLSILDKDFNIIFKNEDKDFNTMVLILLSLINKEYIKHIPRCLRENISEVFNLFNYDIKVKCDKGYLNDFSVENFETSIKTNNLSFFKVRVRNQYGAYLEEHVSKLKVGDVIQMSNANYYGSNFTITEITKIPLTELSYSC